MGCPRIELSLAGEKRTRGEKLVGRGLTFAETAGAAETKPERRPEKAIRGLRR